MTSSPPEPAGELLNTAPALGHCRQYGGLVVRTIPARAPKWTRGRAADGRRPGTVGTDDGFDEYVVASRAGLQLGVVGLRVDPDGNATVSPVQVHPFARLASTRVGVGGGGAGSTAGGPTRVGRTGTGIQGVLVRGALAEIARRRAA